MLRVIDAVCRSLSTVARWTSPVVYCGNLSQELLSLSCSLWRPGVVCVLRTRGFLRDTRDFPKHFLLHYWGFRSVVFFFFGYAPLRVTVTCCMLRARLTHM